MEDSDFQGYGRGPFRHGATSTDFNFLDDMEPSPLVLKPELHTECPCDMVSKPGVVEHSNDRHGFRSKLEFTQVSRMDTGESQSTHTHIRINH